MQEDENTAAVDSTDSPSEEQSIPDTPQGEQNTEEKISVLRSSLFHIAQEEEAEQVSLRVAYQIRQVKERKEHPEKFQPPAPEAAPPPKRKKHALGSWAMGMLPHRGDSGGEIVRKSVFLLSSLVFLVCMVLIALYLIDLYRSKAFYSDVGSSYHAQMPKTTTVPVATELTEEETEVPTEKHYTLLPGAADLLAINPEINGWITIADTPVDYPLLHHPNDVEGEEYYLYRNMQGEDSKPGSIFLDGRCSFDEVGRDGTLSEPNSDNLIVYGHNMRDNSMFGSLKSYQIDENYYQQHPIIQLNSNYETYQYKIFGYFIADASDNTDTRFDYWNKINFADETEFYDYVNEVKRRSLRLTGVDVKYGDALLTLSTCNSSFDTARLVIMARRVRDGEDLTEGTVGSVANPNTKWPNIYYLWNSDHYDPDAGFVPYG